MEEIVDAIEDGRIVKVSAEHARREGLLILRKASENAVVPSLSIQRPRDEEALRRRTKTPLDLDRFRKPLHKDNLRSELKDNFHWEIASMRKSRNMTRKAFAMALNCSEDEIKLVENGVLPRNDFILISQIEKFFNINLRKDKNYQESPRKAAEKSMNEGLGKDVEVFDD